jgi:serine kinase of HPr protein (carbohydrate metabolism regulator)
MIPPTIHASAVLVGARAVLIRGPSGSGKSRLALALLQSARSALSPFARLVADDRVHAENRHGRLILRPAAALEGLLEIRGVGIRKLPFEPVAVARWIVDLAAPDAERLPGGGTAVSIEGVRLARLAVAPGADALPMLLGAIGGDAFSRPAAYKAA